MSLRRVYAAILLLMLILSQFSFISRIQAQSQVFALQSYSYKSSANTNTIYPGSRNVIITVNTVYNGSSPAYISAGCINLPQGFSISRGYSSCAPPQSANGSTHTIAEPGDIIVFTYHIDVNSDTSPGTYSTNITIYYRLQGSTQPFVNVVPGITITVSPYPPLKLVVTDWYWSPDAYPGSQGVYLYITLRNIGNSTVVQAAGKVMLPQNTFLYTQSANRFQVTNNLGKNQTTTISIGPVSIYPNASPGTAYLTIISLNATMSTDDNVYYYTKGNTSFYVTVSSAPAINIQVLDYGIETLKPVQGVNLARFYIVIRNMDFKNVRSIVAYFKIQSPGAIFANSSTTSVTVSQQALGYSDIMTIYSDPITVSNVNYMLISVKLVIFGDNNGAEFWSEQWYSFEVRLSIPTLSLYVTNTYWSSGEVYPGTEGATLNIVLLNNDVVDFRSGTATITLPNGFRPQQLSTSGINIGRGTMTQIAFSGISIDTNILPGEYPAKLILSGVAYDASSNSFYTVSLTLTISVKVFEEPSKDIIALISYGWSGDRAYTTTIDASAYLYLQVTAPGYTVSSPRITIYLPNQMIFESGNRSRTIAVNGDYRYGQYINVEVGGIDVTSPESGFYPVVVKVEALARAPSEYWFTQYFTILLRIDSPILNVSVADFGWVNNPISVDSSGAEIYITLQSFSIDTIESVVTQARLAGASFLSGLSEAVQVITTPINYGEIQTMRFSDVEVKNKTVHVTLVISAVLTTGRNAFYKALKVFNLTLSTVESLAVFRITSLHTSLRGVYAPLLPSARGITISIDLANAKSTQVAWVKPEVIAPAELRINDVSGTCANGVAAGGTCSVDLDVDVSPNATAKNVEILLNLTYAVRSGSTLSLFAERHRVTVPIASYKYYRPSIAIASVYWGTQTPSRALVGQRNVALTVTLSNLGYYPVEAVVIKVSPLNTSVMMVKSSEVCSMQLASGASCSATLYADLGYVGRGGMIIFSVVTEYLFTEFGTAISDSEQFTVSLPVEEPASGRGLELVDASWNNNWPVYPDTENATLVITLANRWPYRVSGIDIDLLLPQGFYTKWGNTAKAYVAGPINSLQQFTVQLQLSVGNIKPGRYAAKLLAKYVVETGTPNTLVEDELNISLVINDLNNSVGVVNVYWVGGSPQPPEYGALLMVVVRDNYNPSMKGVVMEVELPPGIVSADTNTSITRVPASATNILQQIQVAKMTPVQVTQLLSSMLAQQVQTPTEGFSYGDLMYFYLRLNIVTNRTGAFKANAIINFVDQWNNIRRLPISFEIDVLGSAKIVDVVAPTSIAVKRGVASVSIGLINRGSAPLYNVYVYLVPYAAMLIPQQAVKYVDVLNPYMLTNISFTLVYNPFAVSMGATQTYLRYMSVPFSLSIVYRDVYGDLQVFNTSLAFILEPFIELMLIETKASAEGSTITVSGTVANYGIASARSVVIKAMYGSIGQETLIGDVDPASQSSFRLDMNVNSVTSNVVVLQLIYRDDYGRVNTLNYTIPLAIRQIESSTTAPQQVVTYNNTIIIGLVAAFLIVIGIILYRYVRIHSKALEKSFAEITKN